MKAIFLGSIGTIADTSALQLKSFNLAFEKHGLEWVWSPHEYTEMLKIAGGIKRIQRYAAQRGEEVAVKAIHHTKTCIFQDLLATKPVSIRSGINEVIDLARERGLKLALVTTTSCGNVYEILSATCVNRNQFDVVITNEMVKHEKPEPDAYNLALKKLGLRPNEVIAIEDNLDGLKAAISAELECFAFPGCMQSEAIFTDRSIITHDIFQSVCNILNER
tara:strand:- start:606 stop:1265 length:660 start_codon:yes stop_codon:yes gene_type:complete